jgi:predicted Zn-dependent protease
MAFTQTNQLDDISIAAAVRVAEDQAHQAHPHYQDRSVDLHDPPPTVTGLVIPTVWSDRTFNLDASKRGEVARLMSDPAEQAGMLAAGYLSVRGASKANIDTDHTSKYIAYTAAQCSITIRDPGGTASGWAGVSSYDWGRIDPAALAERALKKCIASRNPVAVEPGRYTVILEPQAVHDLVRFMASWLPRRFTAEVGFGPFAAGTREHPHESKVGQKIADDQITISYDPNDPALAVPIYDGVTPVTWVDHGILSVLGYGRDTYALQFMNRNVNQNGDGAYRIAEGNATIDEMIATTKRGLIVTRFSDVSQLEEKSVLLTGFTRDGLWLVENGKITKAVKNFRFTDSPLFMLNNVEQVGRPAIPVFSPDMPAVVPPIKARDFSFTSLIDAI